ncbi:MAG: ABC-type multidrug transport system, ATPase component [Candidatus Gottesmanbacteria bacterium GW2011_GWA1_42_26]|nr:MAG: ABC-type multidrug transport system, ATPase component [Candidatus Gottesmanbacteria bacterium GW2011_GWA1_42_26]
MDKPILEVENLTKTFGDFKAVNNISFTVCEGEIVGLLGPNGAGKTTTIQMLLGIMTQTSGTVCFSLLTFAESDHGAAKFDHNGRVI